MNYSYLKERDFSSEVKWKTLNSKDVGDLTIIKVKKSLRVLKVCEACIYKCNLCFLVLKKFFIGGS